MADAPINPATLFSPKPRPVLAGLAGLSGIGGASATPAGAVTGNAATFPWAARLHQRDAAGLWDLRLLANVEAGLSGEFIWLRGPAWTDQAAVILGRIPSAHWYEAQPGGKLREIERLLPTGRLPQVIWQPLYDAMRIAAPSAALPAQTTPDTRPRVSLELTRSPHEHPANLLIVEARAWRDYIDMEPAVRFQGLYFAAAADGRVCVGHQPPGARSTGSESASFSSSRSSRPVAVLPSLPGRRFWTENGIAVPCGWTWTPALPSGIVRSALWAQRKSQPSADISRQATPPPLPPKFGGSDSAASHPSAKSEHPLAVEGWLYLWHADRAPEWIAAEELIALSRSAARLSLGRQ
ncbi:MAG: hypothetical protein ACAI35_08640 [Candidatus Methylacidiphilales bacterium]|nr:hypothetical protein [Candidatus Methylacidiphilales bacterium]